jgi:RNA polymerase sigma-70 factor (ECF subfamily)
MTTSVRLHRRTCACERQDVAIADARADETAHRRALGEILEREIGKLAPDHRAVFLLREYHELDYAEIARVLEIQIGTVQSRLSRARAALRLALEDVR